MASKVTELPEITSITCDDLLLVVNDPNNIPKSVKITAQNFFSNIQCDVTFSGITTISDGVATKMNVTNDLIIGYRLTPATSSDAAPKGKIWFDDNYLYVAVADNTIKRIPLQSF